MDITLLETLDYMLESDTSIKLHVDKVYEILNSLDSITDDERTQISFKIKSKVQREANYALNAAGGSGAIIMATGTGKSKVAIDRIVSIVTLDPKAKILIVVPTERLRDEGWKAEFIKWKQEAIWSKNVRTVCYMSLTEYMNFTGIHVFLDEGHNLTENSAKFFNQNELSSCVLLTATVPDDMKKKELFKSLGLNIVYEVNLEDAVKLGLVAPYELYIVTMTLDSVDKYIASGTKIKTFYQTERDKYKYLSNLAITTRTKINLLKRMRFIYNLRSKTQVAKKILDHVIPKNKRTIIFCSTIEQSIEVCDKRFFSKPALSKGDKPERIEAVKKALEVYNGDRDLMEFINKEINRIACINSLNEGHNIPEPDCGFIIQVNSKELDLVQRIGRFIRYRPNHIAKVIILTVLDTVDMDWVTKATRNLNPIRLKVIDLMQLRTGEEKISFD